MNRIGYVVGLCWLLGHAERGIPGDETPLDSACVYCEADL